MYHEPETWIVFTHAGHELVRVTAEHTFHGEVEAILELHAYEQGCAPAEIAVSYEEV